MPTNPSDEPAAQAHALLERLFALLHECRALVPQLEAGEASESMSAQAERLLYYALVGAIEAGLVRTAEDALTVLRQASQPLGADGRGVAAAAGAGSVTIEAAAGSGGPGAARDGAHEAGTGELLMKRRRILAGLLLSLAAPLVAEAQPPAKVPRIGVIPSGAPATSAAYVEAFRQRLREFGYVEGRSITIEVRYAGAQPERLRAAAQLVGLGVDVIVVSGTLATRAAKEETSTIPIVMVTVGDAVGAGLVKTLPRPGGNITGNSFLGPEIALKGFDLLTEAIPRATRLAVLFNPEIAPDPIGFPALGVAAQAKGVTLQPVELRRSDDLNPAFAAMGRARANALLVFAVSPFQQKRIVEFAAKNRLPALYGFREAVDAGGLMSFGPKFLDLWRGAANYVDKILKGAKPGDLPVEQPTTFELVINLKTAKALGLTIPPSLLLRADEVIQ